MFVLQPQNVGRYRDETTQNKRDQKKYEAKTTTKIQMCKLLIRLLVAYNAMPNVVTESWNDE